MSEQQESNDDAGAAPGAETTSRGQELVSHLFELCEIPRRSRSKLVQEALNLSYHAAHRRVIGQIPWMIEEIEQLAERLGHSLADLLHTEKYSLRATCEIAGQTFSCEFVPAEPSASTPLVALETPDGWRIVDRASAQGTNQKPVGEIRVLIPTQQRPRVAVLDDSQDVTDSLVSYLLQTGFDVRGYTSLESLASACNAEQFDAYILDLLIDSQNVSKLIGTIRKAAPLTPIFVLTGKIREGAVSPEDIASVVAAHQITFFEKPAPTAIIAANLKLAFAKKNSEA